MRRRTGRAFGAAVVAAVSAMLVAACAPFLPGSPDGPFNGDWLLVEAGWGDTGFRVDRAGITLMSDGRSAAGFSGCSEYAFELSGDADEFRIAEAVGGNSSSVTADELVTCHGYLDRLESRYLSLLLAADEVERTDTELVLRSGDSSLVFVAFPPVRSSELLRTEWVLSGYGNTWQDRWSTDIVGSPTLRFLDDERFVGSLGCGGFVGNYRVVRTQLFVTTLHRQATEECRSEGSAQDALFARFLDGFRVIVLGREHLVLLHNQTQLFFTAANRTGIRTTADTGNPAATAN
jgi:heat shock protein HslJ